jgi:hypothetical protein
MPLPVIPPLVIWTLGALGVTALARVLVREHRRINEELDAARSAAAVTEKAERAHNPTLRRDPRTGVYRPD